MASNQNTSLKSTVNTDMKFYPDMFEILDQDDEIEQNWNDKQIWDKIKEEFNFDYNFDNTYDNMQEQQDEEFMEYMSGGGDDDETFEDQVLSQPQQQQLNRLSTIPTTTVEPVTKQFRADVDSMPEYLRARNQLFDRMIEKRIQSASPMDMDHLRQMAFFRHQIAHFNQLSQLWSAYLRAGIGSLKDDQDEEQEQDVSKQIDRRYWSQEVKSIVEANSNWSPTNLTEEARHHTYQDLVYKHLNEYCEKIQLYEQQFNQKKEENLLYWTSTIEEAIQTFVQQYGIHPLQMKYNHQIAILTYEYEDQILQRQYQQQNPTLNQKQIAHDFYETEFYLETIKNESIEYQERIRCNKPPTSYNDLEIPLPSSIHTITNQHIRQQLWNRYEKLLEQTKTDLLAVHLAVQQATIYQYQTLVNEKQIANKDMPETLRNLLHQRSVNMKNKLKLISDFTIHYYLHSSYSEFEMMTTTTKRTGFLSHLLIDSTLIEHHLTERQLQLLNRGPTYIPPGQLHILASTHDETRDNWIKKQYAPLKHQIAILHDKYNAHGSNAMNFQEDTFKIFENLYSQPLPSDIYQRAIYEKKFIRSVQYTLKKNDFLLRRTADQQNTFYLGPMQDFIHLSNQYIENNTGTYSILFDLNEMTIQDVQQQLKTRYLSLNSELDELFEKKRFNNITHRKLRVKIEHVKLPYLYFLPEISTTPTTHSSLQVQPMISAHHSMTSKLAQFLKQIIRPLLLHNMPHTIFINEADFMKKLLSYTTNQEHHDFSPKTLFVTIKITNFSTMASHESIVRRLEYFLFDHTGTNKVCYATLKALNLLQYISIDTVKKLTEFYLKNNLFYYNGKIYELKKGAGPTSLLLSELLSNIYLFTYDKYIYDNEKLKTEFYGRYKDQIFFTWNQSQEELKLFLDDIANNYSNIHIETDNGTCVQYFHAQIENRHGHLYTSVYHPSSSSKYTLPYVIDPVKSNHSLWFRSALIRAVHYCSNVYDFNQEQIYLVMACLTYGYSIDFIHIQLKHFYLRFNLEKIIGYCPNQTIYEQLRHRLFNYIDVQRTRSDKYQELDDKEYIFRFSYPYDYGAYHQFHRKFQELWKKYFQEDCQLTHKDTQIHFIPKSIYSLNTLLAQQKPSHELLNA